MGVYQYVRYDTGDSELTMWVYINMSGIIREILNLTKGAWLVNHVRGTFARIIWQHVFCLISPNGEC